MSLILKGAKRFGYRVTVEVPPGFIGVHDAMPDDEAANRLIQEYVDEAVKAAFNRRWGVLTERKSASGKLILGRRKNTRWPLYVAVTKPVKSLRAKDNPKAIQRIAKGT